MLTWDFFHLLKSFIYFVPINITYFNFFLLFCTKISNNFFFFPQEVTFTIPNSQKQTMRQVIECWRFLWKVIWQRISEDQAECDRKGRHAIMSSHLAGYHCGCMACMHVCSLMSASVSPWALGHHLFYL